MKISQNKITFLNHSSVLIESSDIKILCDPWFEGSSFNNGWRLLNENSHNINEIDFDYIWISHEHPDHFSIPTLSKLKKKVHFLYQATQDKKVFKYLIKKGHKVTEIDDCIEVDLNGLKIVSFVADGYDSAALFTFSNGDQYLNINDARVELFDTINKIKKYINGSLKLISIQFSYANWSGNEGDKEIPLHQQQMVLERLYEVYDRFKPDKLLLFASFVYYSHEENFYSNKEFWLPYVLDKLKIHGIDCIVPIPNQKIFLNEISQTNFDLKNAKSLSYWEECTKKIKILDFTNTSYSLDSIFSAYSDWYDKIWESNSLILNRTEKNNSFSFKTYLSDLKITIEFSLFKRLVVISDVRDYDCIISTDTLIFLFQNNFSRGTISVNGRIQFHYPTAHRFFIFFFIPYLNNIGKYFSEIRITSNLLDSIRKTSVMLSILHFNIEARVNFQKDIDLFT